MGDYDVELERRINDPDIVHITLSGQLDEQEAIAAAERSAEKFEQAEEGFYLINDISDFVPLSQDAAGAIEKGKQAAAEAGAQAAVRVTGDSVVGEMQFERVGDGGQYEAATAETVDEARELLEGF